MSSLDLAGSEPVVRTRGSQEPQAPLVVLLHGRGATEVDIIDLAELLPTGPAYAAVRAPLAAELGGFAWFANRGIGRPIAASLRSTLDWFDGWLAQVAPAGRSVVLVGFSGGAAFAGGLILDRPERFAGAAILFGTLPFDAGLPVTPGRLSGLPVFVAQGDADTVIPVELQRHTWSYLHEESGADLTAVRHSGGHSLDPGTLGALNTWIQQLCRLDRVDISV